MTASFPRLLLMMLFLCSPALAADKVYKWTDENGVVHYDAKPPEQAEAQTVDIRRAPPPPPATVPDQSPPTEEVLRAAQCTSARGQLQVLLANETVDVQNADGTRVRLSPEEREAQIEMARKGSEQWCKDSDES
ncbi:MAG: DUF4124 domain-containing protein [Xanthomonadales bacterium]|nr:DUF4124 domain-containing protein [Xanthomonadales bacterium]MCB1634193.1 DUF4124 domain-containing protein [Xanthomonadales bacterium]